MPSGDLNRVAQDLRTIKAEALQAQQNLANMRKEIEAMVAAMARGGAASGAGIRQGTDTLLLGAGTTSRAQRADPRVRLEGGARFNLDRGAREMQTEIAAYTQAVIDQNIQYFRVLGSNFSNVRPADIESRFQQALSSMEQAFRIRLGQIEAIFQAGFASLPPGSFTLSSLAGAGLGPPQLPAGTPSVRGGVPGAPLLPMGQRAGPGFVPQMDFSGGEVIEGKIIETTGALDAIIIEERKLLAAVSQSTLAEQRAAEARQEAADLAEQLATDLGPPESGAGETREQRAKREGFTRADYDAVEESFRRTYGTDAPERLAAVQAQATQAGFDPKADIKDVEAYAGAYTRVNYAVRDAEGIMRKMTVTVDKAGNTLTSTQKQFRTFFGAIRRNIGEMIKWSAAVLLVWGSIRKLQELLTLAIENETQLANVAVVLGEEHANLAKIFDDAATAAFATGESITGVIEGYAAAYRATGNIADQAERSRVAQELLTDSLVLSKLSTLSQAEALDTLVGALRQVGLDLDQGAELMDKWVRVSRFAQVSIETLAESFAITATSAQNAGVSVEYLNGLIATIAEVTTLSASESGNAIRAFISSFKSDSAVKELGQFGIAVTDLQGETRDFLSIMQEVAALFEAGVISEQQLNQIGRAIGGRGARREAQVVAVIKNLTRAEALAELQTNATGEAQAALNIQLETVQTALTRLDNSFLTLARTMGSEGGVLDSTSAVLELFTGLVDATSALTKNMGSITPIMAGLGLVMAATSSASRQFYYGEGVSAVAGGISRVSPRGGAGALDLLTRPGRGRGAQFFGGGAAQVGAIGLAGYQAYRGFQQGDPASAGGAIAGAFIGAAVSGGSPIGIAIGSAAGQALANAVFNYEADFEAFWAAVIGEGTKRGREEAEAEPQVSLEQQAIDESLKVVGRGSEPLGQLFTFLGSLRSQGVAGALNLFGADIEPISREEELARGVRELGEGDRIEALVQEAKEFREAQAGLGADEGFDFEFINRQLAYLEQYGTELDQLEKAEADLARTRALSGEITERELRTSLEIIPKLQSGISSFAVGFGDAFAQLNPQITTATDTMGAFARIMIQSSPEQIAYLSGINSEIARLTNLMQLAEEAGEDFIVFKQDDPATEESEEIRYNLQESNAELERLRDNAALFATSLHQAAQAAFIQLPTISTLDIRPDDLGKVLDRAREAQREYIRSTFAADLNEGVSIQDIEATFDPIMIQAGESGGYTYAEGFISSFLNQVIPQMQAAGEILAPQPTALPIRQLDISSGQLPALMARYQALVESIRSHCRSVN
jgi:TP901 family phage tail tape measure protein